MAKEVILTGLRSNAEFHIGNYLGAILPMVNLQKKYAGAHQFNMFIPDLHSFTTPIDHGSLYEQSLQNLNLFVAAGLDINAPDTYIYRQSYVPAHSEMTWILDCFSYFGELSRMTEFKDKSTGKEQDNISVGLFNYPALMAADILLYGAKWVPVGDDQRQHLEFTRDIATRINNKFGELLVVPEPIDAQLKFSGRDQPVRIRSVRSPEKKMSKSVEDPAGTIMLSDKPEEAAQNIMSATTDSLGKVSFDWEKQPGVTNLLQILALFSGRPQEEVNREWAGKSSYDELKTATSRVVGDFLSELQANLAKIDQAEVKKKLEAGEAAMSRVAETTLLKVQKAVGLRPR